MKYVLLTASVLIASTLTPTFADELNGSEKQIKRALEKSKSIQKLPSSRATVAFDPLGQAVVITDNPRWVVKGTLYDMWSNEEVRSTTTLNAKAKRIPLNNIRVNSTDVLDITVNPEKSSTVTIFLDPFSENSSDTVHILTKYASDYQLRFIMTAFSEDNLKKLSSFNCSFSNLEANEVTQLIIKRNIPLVNQSCMNEQLVNSFALSQFVGVRQSPTIIAPNNVYNVGLPPKLMTWLAQNTEK